MGSWTFVALSTNITSCDFFCHLLADRYIRWRSCGGNVTIGIGLMRLAGPKLPPLPFRLHAPAILHFDQILHVCLTLLGAIRP